MTARQMEQLSAAAMQELDDEGLGAFGRKLPWGSYGMLARASLTAPDAGRGAEALVPPPRPAHRRRRGCARRGRHHGDDHG
jgi:hypothetical protein